jgi:hypothetical protein
MLGRSRAELILIRAAIVFINKSILIWPALLLGFVLVPHLVRHDTTTTTPRPPLVTPLTLSLALLTTAEAAFYALLWRPHVARRLAAAAAVHPPPLTSPERLALFRRVLADVDDPEAYLRGWFLGAAPADIRRDNVADFLAWAFFDSHVHDVLRGGGHPVGDSSAGDSSAGTSSAGCSSTDSSSTDPSSSADPSSAAADLESMLAHIEGLLARPLALGRGPAVPLRLTLDPVEARYRSVLWYALLAVVDLATHALLSWRGFQYHAQPAADVLSVFPPRPQQLWASRRSAAPGMAYWYRPASEKTTSSQKSSGEKPPAAAAAVPSPSPVLFLHGIGVGLVSYLPLLLSLPTSTPVIAVEVLPISSRLCPPPLARAEFLSALADVLSSHDTSPTPTAFTLVGHSYGTVLATHVLRHARLRSRVASVVLVDPVSIRLHLPDVAVNFTRRVPRSANEWQLWFFASTDPGVAECLARWFFWRDNVLWRDDVVALVAEGKRVAVFLAGRDLIVDAWAVHRHLEPVPGVDLVMLEHLDHSQVLDEGRIVSECVAAYAAGVPK